MRIVFATLTTIELSFVHFYMVFIQLSLMQYKTQVI